MPAGIRARAFAIADRLMFPEVGVRGSLTVGPGADAWRAWLTKADEGLVRHALALLETLVEAKS
jgi:hypothetical protein